MAAATAHQLLEGGEGLEAEVAEEGELVGVAEVGQQQLGRGGGAGALGTLQHLTLLQHLSLLQHLTLLQHRYCSHLVTAVVSSNKQDTLLTKLHCRHYPASADQWQWQVQGRYG